MSQHRDHQVGTISGCRHCTEAAYEPSWYASLLAFSQTGDVGRFGSVQLFST